MRYIKYALIAAFGIALIAIAMANRNVVEIQLIPDELAALVAVNPAIELPLFLVVYAGIVIGLMVGFVWEWLREHSLRAAASRNERERRRLAREVKKLKGEKHAGKDEVLALLDEAG